LKDETYVIISSDDCIFVGDVPIKRCAIIDSASVRCMIIACNGRLRGTEMIVCNVREWSFINGWMNKGGTHSQRSPIQAYIPVATIHRAPGGVNDGVGDIGEMLTGTGMIICNIREWRFVNEWTNEGGTHSQRSPIPAYIAVATINSRGVHK